MQIVSEDSATQDATEPFATRPASSRHGRACYFRNDEPTDDSPPLSFRHAMLSLRRNSVGGKDECPNSEGIGKFTVWLLP
jgi:hypothetical protein